MSLINEALKKAGKEKGAQDPFSGVPGSPESPSPQKKERNWEKVILFSLMGIIGTGVVVSMTLFKRSSPRPLPQRAAQQTPPIVPVTPKEAPPPPQETASTPTTPAASSQSSPIVLKSSLTLNGIVQGEGEDLAILNNQITKIGEDIEGATLLEIGKDSVLLEEGEKRFRLKLK